MTRRHARGSRRAPRPTGPLEGFVRDIAHGGDGVVETERGVVFVPGVLPGERVRISGARRAGQVWRGRCEAILEPSPDRVEPACPLVARCGGCPLMAAALPVQREVKRERVARATGVPVVLEGGGPGLGYRRRARLSWWRSGDAVRVGYRPRREHGVVDVPRCAVLRPELDAALGRLREWLAPHLEGEGELRLGLGRGRAAAVALRSEDAQPPDVYDAARRLAKDPAVAGVSMRVGGATAEACFGDPREHVETVDGDLVVGPVDAFHQANDEVNRRLVEAVLELAEPEGRHVVELYAGQGNLTLPLARRAASVTAVETDAAAVESCREALERARLKAHVLEGDAATRLGANAPAEVVVLDPPRTGARAALPVVAGLGAARLVYVSCDPATLARDLAALARFGYRVDLARAFDMFPQTAHVEAVVRLVPRADGHGPVARSRATG